MSGGDLNQKGYNYNFFLVLPSIFLSQKSQAITGGTYKTTVFDFPTSFLLTRNNIYVYISICVLGFGLGFRINTKEITNA